MAVHLNPADIEILKHASTSVSHLTLVADDLVASGGASLRALDQVIDDRFENRLREIRESALTIAADLSKRGRD
jgi:flagellar biosynthesis/type III secretory pathway protein FliH